MLIIEPVHQAMTIRSCFTKWLVFCSVGQLFPKRGPAKMQNQNAEAILDSIGKAALALKRSLAKCK